MRAATALLRASASDPRPALGFVVGMISACMATSVVLDGSVRLLAGSPLLVDAVETVLLLTATVSVVGVFLTASAFARSLQPEIERLEVLGDQSGARVFGTVAVTGGVTLACVVAAVSTAPLAEVWSGRFAAAAAVTSSPADRSASGLLCGFLAFPALCGWSSGTRAKRQRAERRRLIAAVSVAGTFIVPTIGAVVFAPTLIELARGAGEVAPADKLDLLASSAAGIAVLTASVFGLVTGATIIAGSAVRLSMQAAARCLSRGPLWFAVALRLAARRADRFGPFATVSVGTVGLVAGQAAAVSLEHPTGTAGADWVELALTLGPSMVIAFGTSAGMALAQSRGTGSDLRALTILGLSSPARAATVLTTSAAIGVSGALMGLVTAGIAVLLAMPFGLAFDTVRQPDALAPLVVGLVMTLATTLVFLGSELWGSRLSR